MTDNTPKPSDIKPRPKAKPEKQTLDSEIKSLKARAQGEKPKFVRKPHLTQRPFHNPGLVSLRDGLKKSYNIKKG